MIGCDTPTQRSQTSHRRPGPSSKMRSYTDILTSSAALTALRSRANVRKYPGSHWPKLGERPSVRQTGIP
jgi:hypothetical protein